MGPTGRSRLDSRIQFAQKLVDDLASLKELSEDVERREREKLDAALLEQEFVDTVYFPVAKLLPPILDKAFA
jgi:NuA3 HAT complex component NTO1